MPAPAPSGKTGPKTGIVLPTKPSPIIDDSPTPKIVSASPVATWLDASVSVRKAKIIDAATAATIAARMPEQRGSRWPR